MIVGESGTGKEIVARRIHELSLRRQAPFVAVNLSSIPLSLCESELFGYEKGAFTGADRSKQGLLTSANGGTLFLDELSSMSIELQPKLLRAIESKNIMPLGSTKSFEIDVRFISALNISPYQLIKQNKLREDLFYRLSVVVIDLPPLRERTEDIPALINYFVAKFSKQNEKENLVVAQDFIDACLNYAWPGNIRELKNVVERAVVLSTSNELTKKDLPEHIANQNSNTDHEIRIKLGMTLEAIESKVIEETLKNCGGDKNKAAQILGINPRTIHRWQSKNFSF
jgi:transcriptional regulator with PAS, ATPase and Fis domain